MIFLDTSAIYAWADAADPNHPTSVRRLQAILERGEELLTHNYVLVESLALLQSRLGVRAAVKLAQDAPSFVVEWVDDELHASGVRELERSKANSKLGSKGSAALEKELHALRREREEVRSRIEKLVEQIELLTKPDSAG